ncbi:unnamed protein product, partial [Candidula unifasciata]
PSDPIEYMGLWLYRYADIRNYFKKKKSFYEELLTTKMDMENKKMKLLQKHNEAILDITEPLVRPHDDFLETAATSKEPSTIFTFGSKTHSAASASIFKILSTEPETKTDITSDTRSEDDKRRKESSSEQSTIEKQSLLSQSQTPGSTSNDNKVKSGSDVSDNSSLSRGQASISPTDSVTKRLRDFIATDDKPRPSKTHRKSIGHRQSISASVNQPRKKSKRKSEIEDELGYDKKSGESEQLINFNYFDTEDRRRSSLEVMPAKWSVSGNQVICQHPLLGQMSIQGRRYSVSYEQTIELVDDFVAYNMYDPELYIHDPTPEEIAAASLFSDQSSDKESERRSPTVLSDFILND